MIDGEEHVFLKFGVVFMFFCIFQKQTQLGDQIFQVMYDEGRHPVKGFELAGHQQGFAGPLLGQTVGQLMAGRFEQVAHFPVEFDLAQGLSQQDESDQLVVEHEGDDQPGILYL